MASSPSPNFWSGKRVVLTGHTGFKGAWLAIWLERLGADVMGISLPPRTTPNLFKLAGIDRIKKSVFVDIRNVEEIAEHIQAEKPEIVFHLAAQAIVRASYRDPLDTFSTNVMGTANVLDLLQHIDSVRAVVVVTTDKVYRNLGNTRPYRETDRLGGNDPYSASKAAAEMVIESYREAFFNGKEIAIASARAGNVIGGGDWSEDRLIPDAIRAWGRSQSLHVRNPQAVRPWQHVLEPLRGYLKLAERLWQEIACSGAYNFGPLTHEAALVQDVITKAKASYGSGEVLWEGDLEGPHEDTWLALEVSKSREVLGVHPRWSLEEAINRTMQWYRQQQRGADARTLCEADISSYEATESDVLAR